jgi:hypothetical protein
MKEFLLTLAPLVILLGVFLYKYEKPKPPKNKTTGRGGDFAE